jgi:DNA (cytosine-5)-methyltransferase 1
MIAPIRRKKLRILDLFCGAGGTSDGAVEAAEELGFEPELTAINHWDVAIETHMANHPTARTLLTAVDNVAPRDLYGPGELDLLWASPECTHHSVARGGRPINDQSRATAWCVVRFADALQPPVILVENVPEFVTWGGLCRNGRPLERQKGKTFLAWIAALRSLGYRMDWRVLCAADQGDPTLRKRLIIQGVRGRYRNIWPEPTHAPAGVCVAMLKQPYVPAARIIDWRLRGMSVFERPIPLVVKTMRRILVGLEKWSLAPFLVPPQGYDERVRSVDVPLNTVTCEARGNGLVESRFIVEHRGTNDRQIAGSARSIEEPLSTVATSGAHHALSEAFVLPNDGPNMHWNNDPKPVDEPLGSVTASRGAGAVVQSHFLIQTSHGEGREGANGNHRRVRGVDVPLPTVCGNRGDFAFITTNFGERDGQTPRVHSVGEPLPTVTGAGAGSLIQTSLRPDFLTEQEWAVWTNAPHRVAALLPQQSGGALRPVAHPAPTVSAAGAIGLVDYIVSIDHQGSNGGCVKSAAEPMSNVTTKARHLFLHPFMVKYYGTGISSPVSEPVPTVTTKERFGFAQPRFLHCGQGTFRRVSYPAWKRLILWQTRRRRKLTRLYMQSGDSILMLEITHRMLQPPELAGAQGFRPDYKFCGNKTEQVRQIGNAVPRRLAKACVRAVLTQSAI